MVNHERIVDVEWADAGAGETAYAVRLGPSPKTAPE